MLFAEYNNLQNRSINLRMADEVGSSLVNFLTHVNVLIG